MGSIWPELNLDYRPAANLPKTITGFLRDLSMIGNGNISEKLSKLDDYIQRLEEEKNKIDAFKRELPLSLILLNDAIESLKDERIHIRPVMEEFVLLKRDSNEEGEMNKEEECCDKKNWMSSVQLWTSNGHPNSNNIKHSDEEDDDSAIENPVQPCQYKNGVGAFMPFNGCSSFPMNARNEDKGNSNFPVLSRKEDELVPDLSLLTPGIKTPTRTEQSSSGFSSKSNGSSSGDVPSSSTNVQSHVQRMETQQQPCRKQRRCWSPELHRRFVSALQQLGGSQVATPKQIRELMKVDGLTNDEVKSHLQKYRLHTRRHLSTTSPADQSEVVLKGLWMHQDQYGALSKPNISQSSSPQGPLQLAGTAGGISATCCDSMDDEEDGRSESYSWKGQLHKEGADV